jgi:hypothetical protein
MLRRQQLLEYWYISGTTAFLIFCISLTVYILPSSSACCVTILMTHPPTPAPAPSVLTEPVFWQESPAGTRQTDSKNLVGFGEIERKLAKLSMTTFT